MVKNHSTTGIFGEISPPRSVYLNSNIYLLEILQEWLSKIT